MLLSLPFDAAPTLSSFCSPYLSVLSYFFKTTIISIVASTVDPIKRGPFVDKASDWLNVVEALVIEQMNCLSCTPTNIACTGAHSLGVRHVTPK